MDDIKARFIVRHPRCCFCGGKALTEERDEQPPMTFFVERKWPKGYQFPACATCNRRSRLDDLVLGYVGRFFNPDESHIRDRDLERILYGIRNNLPELLPDLNPSTNEKRRALRAMGIEKPQGVTYADLPMVGMSERVFEHVRSALRKLTCALFYKHIDRILPPDGALISAAEFNLAIADSKLAEELLPRLQHPTITRWNSEDISDQFCYRWTYDSALRAFVFLGLFAGAFVGLGCALETRERLLTEELRNPWFDLGGKPVNVGDLMVC
jgi:hypothetical protein